MSASCGNVKYSSSVHILKSPCLGQNSCLRNLRLTFDYSTYSQKLGEDFSKFCGLLRIYELYLNQRMVPDHDKCYFFKLSINSVIVITIIDF